jgi:hypothetical protein
MANLLSIPPVQTLDILEVRRTSYDNWKEQYAADPQFGYIWHALLHPIEVNKTPFIDYTIRDGWLYKLNQLCVPHSDDRLVLAHSSSYGGHFGTTNTLEHLHRYFFWPSMQKKFDKFIRACSLCSQSKTSNRKHGLYQPLPIPYRLWE